MSALLLICAFAPVRQAAWADGPGTTAANFLKIPVGPRQVGMGDQGVSLADDAFSLSYNPASISLLNYQEAAFMHTQWVEGVSQKYLAYVHPKLGPGNLGAGINLVQVGSFQGYDANGAKAESVSAQDLLFSLAYAGRVWGAKNPQEGLGLSAGLSLKFLRERLENNSASAYAGDVGLLCYFPLKTVSMKAGLAAQNFGSKLGYYENQGRLPRTLAFGLSGLGRIWGDPATLAVEMRKAVDNGVDLSVGGEYWVNSLLAFRLGYRFQHDLGPGLRAGIGLKIKIVQFDYGMSPMGAMGITHRAGITIRFGAPVEKIYEPTVQDIMVGKTVQRVRFLLGEKKYLDALLEVNRVLELDPTQPEAVQLLDQIQKILTQIEDSKKL
jgi:hypothetical protein